jgi:hypothetical protein
MQREKIVLPNINCMLSDHQNYANQSKWLMHASEIRVGELYILPDGSSPTPMYGTGGGYKPTPTPDYSTTPTPSYGSTPSTPSTPSYGIPEIPKHGFTGSCE